MLRRNKAAARLTANRHSFFGFDSPSMVDSKDNAVLDEEAYRIPDSSLLSAINLSSTPRSKTLHPLMEDDACTPETRLRIRNSKNLELDPIFNSSKYEQLHHDKIQSQNDMCTGVNSKDDYSTINVETDFSRTTSSGSFHESKTDSKYKHEAKSLDAINDFDEESIAGLKIGDTVQLSAEKSGTVRFLGRTKFAEGLWAGLELSNADGRNF